LAWICVLEILLYQDREVPGAGALSDVLRNGDQHAGSPGARSDLLRHLTSVLDPRFVPPRNHDAFIALRDTPGFQEGAGSYMVHFADNRSRCGANSTG
jgi:hypothetical protein